MYTWETSQPVTDFDLLADLNQGWNTQEEAETWLKDTFADFLDEDIHELTLVVGDEVVYSMSLDDD